MSTAALAADLPLAPPPAYAPAPVDYGGWYLRGDIGFSNQKVNNIRSTDTALYTPLTSFGETTQFDSAGIYDVGVGYQFNSWFRGDLTAQYRGSANFKGTDLYTYSNAGVPTNGVDQYSASKSEWLFLANGYVDLGTWWCVTPFVGAGVGTSRVSINGFTDTNVPVGGVDVAGSGSKWNFAWAAYAGLAYRVNQNLTVELAYSYVDLGSGVTANSHAYNAAPSPYVFQFNNITSQDVKIGLRWAINPTPVYQPPLITKG
jgi:opacity protein-like surface antigen